MATNSGNSGFRITVDTLTVGLEIASHFEDDVMDDLNAIVKAMVQDAQDNAPWDDRTGDARRGLDASVEEHAGIYTVTLAHGVDYGQWLETIQSGQYAIIMPTIEAWADDILTAVGHGIIREE